MSSGMEELYYPKIMCQLCFAGFDKEQLWLDTENQYWDVCKQCKAEEYWATLSRIKKVITEADFFGDEVAPEDIIKAFAGVWEDV